MSNKFLRNKWFKRVTAIGFAAIIYMNFYYIKEPWLYAYYNWVKDFSMYEEKVPKYPLFPEFPGVDENNNGVLDRIEVKFLSSLTYVKNPKREWIKHYGMLMFQNYSEVYTEDFTNDEFRDYWWTYSEQRVHCFKKITDYLTYNNKQGFRFTFDDIYNIGVPTKYHAELRRNVRSLFNGKTIRLSISENLIILLKEECGDHKDNIEITKAMYESFIKIHSDREDSKFFHKKVRSLIYSKKFGEKYEERFKVFNPMYKK
ncbi:MAG: hypothetical protein GY909_08420 [Oligoflexia bacterium]|nr:hypothetical protein [Oligoflexia bacterium]